MKTWYTKYIKLEEAVAYERLGWRLDRDALRDTPHGTFAVLGIWDGADTPPAPEGFHDVKMLSLFKPGKKLFMHIISTPTEEPGPDRYTNVYLTMDHIRYLHGETEKILKDE